MVRDYLLTAAVMAALSGIWFLVQHLRQAGADRGHSPVCEAPQSHCHRSCHRKKNRGERR